VEGTGDFRVALWKRTHAHPASGIESTTSESQGGRGNRRLDAATAALRSASSSRLMERERQRREHGGRRGLPFRSFPLPCFCWCACPGCLRPLRKKKMTDNPSRASMPNFPLYRPPSCSLFAVQIFAEANEKLEIIHPPLSPTTSLRRLRFPHDAELPLRSLRTQERTAPFVLAFAPPLICRPRAPHPARLRLLDSTQPTCACHASCCR
jgi:hypothetical protein